MKVFTLLSLLSITTLFSSALSSLNPILASRQAQPHSKRSSISPDIELDICAALDVDLVLPGILNGASSSSLFPLLPLPPLLDPSHRSRYFLFHPAHIPHTSHILCLVNH
jgi:hypothetical protein